MLVLLSVLLFPIESKMQLRMGAAWAVVATGAAAVLTVDHSVGGAG